MEIKEVRLLLPAMVKYTCNGEDLSAFVYIDQIEGKLVTPDETVDSAELKECFLKYNSKKPRVIPEPPKNVQKFDIKEFNAKGYCNE
jgi:hypothetical protein